ncbi:MAG: prephenate dehydrogenase/arogenate dehydrogenase family protein [Verrucomicrobiota bacterium]
MLCRKFTLIGVGLLGGSLGLAVRRRRLAGQVEGYVRRSASLAECERAGAVDHATTDLAAAVTGADLVVLCTPVGQMRALAEAMRPSLAPGAVVTDVGSVKGSVVGELEPCVAAAGAHFIGSHPMAGAETTGVANARADLFEGAVCVVTPTAQTDQGALRLVEDLWQQVGGRLLRLPPGTHDEFVARTSHLPQALAATLVNFVLDEPGEAALAALCAGGFRDSTRIASGSPEMWRDIALANRGPLTQALAQFSDCLAEFRAAIERGDAAAVTAFLETARRRRDDWLRQPRNNAPE